MQTVQQLYEKVKDLLTPDEYRERVDSTRGKFGGLLTDEVAALLVIEELGRFEVQYDQISSLKMGQLVRLRAEVVSVNPPKEFARKDNSVGRVASARISDGSSECRLVLWDDDTQLVSCGALKPGVYVRVINGYTKITDYGLEVSKGRFGSVVLE